MVRILFVALLFSLTGAQEVLASETKPGSHIITPIIITDTGGRIMNAERGFFFAPENRAAPKSRTIAIHFVRFPADNAVASRPPVFMLPGGPGVEKDFSNPSNFSWVKRLRRTRDVIYVSQRGNYLASKIVADMRVNMGTVALDQQYSPALASLQIRAAVEEAFDTWSSKGIDLAGYDILNIVDDVHDLRRSLGYDKIVLNGCSFGSQWSFSYIKRWPDTVDRALLGGIEPLDYAYDSPKWLWASMTRLAAAAEASPTLKQDIPEGGLMNALKEVLKRLGEKAHVVTITDPKTGKDVDVTVGADDLRKYIARAWSFMKPEARANLAQWPRHIIELYNGDYRYLAAFSWYKRSHTDTDTLIEFLIDNSLGITAARDEKLTNEVEAQWLGNINADYHATRGITPTPLVSDSFRADWEIDVPVLLVTSDLDWSTPVENARHARKFLKQGHLLEVAGGTHCTEYGQVPAHLPEVTEQIFSFIDADFESIKPQTFFETLPTHVSLPPIDFAPENTNETLYDEWLLMMKNR
ncbi:MAG: alpha/beta hydrolase [Kordiimonadaceae bacterium]|nr:alpha/beta hydrolase [Kordiimonadaceae bacterium]